MKKPSDEFRCRAQTDEGMRFVGMRERAALVGDNLEIESAPNSGTTIFARVPLNKRAGGIG